MQEEVVSFNITNTTNGSIPMSIMGNNTDVMDNSNASTRYFWDLTGFALTNEDTITIQYQYSGQSGFSIASVKVQGTTLQSVADALNTLNIGTFFLTSSGGSTYLNNYNQNVAYGSISITSSASIINPLFFVGSGFQGATTLVRQLRLQSSGKIIACGEFLTYQGNSLRAICRINSDGIFDTTFNSGGTGFDSYCDNMVVQSDDKIVCVGQFTTYNGVTTPDSICRINADGSLDTTFNSGGAGFNLASFAWSTAIQSDGKILVGGTFNTYNGNVLSGIVRINTNGSYDGTFNTLGAGFTGGVNYMVNTISIQTDGKIICGGDFTSYNGVAKIGIIRLTSTGVNDGTFLNLSAGATCWTSAIQSDGKIILGGSFTSYGGNSVSNIVRLNSDGTYDATFVSGTGFGSTVTNIAIQSDGKIICSGMFGSYNGTTANGIIRLNSDGSIDTSWNYGLGIDSSGENQPILIQPNSNIVLGGLFDFFDGQSYNKIVGLLS